MTIDPSPAAARPRKRTWGVVIAAAILAASAGGFLAYRHWGGHRGDSHTGQACVYSSECGEAPCIHEFGGETYCATLCDTDEECSSAYVCEPTRSGLRHACMKAGVETGIASEGNRVYRRAREP